MSSWDYYSTNFDCSGTESDIDECSSKWASCSSYKCVSVICTLEPPKTSLSGRDSGFLTFEGQFVCNDDPFGPDFEKDEAKVVCRELGFKYVKSVEKRNCPDWTSDFGI